MCVAIHLIGLTTYAVKPSSVVLKTTEDDNLGKINTQVTNVAVLFPVTWKIFAVGFKYGCYLPVRYREHQTTATSRTYQDMCKAV